MNVIQLALAVEKWTAKQAPITVRADHCLNTRDKACDCAICRQVCPTEAITLDGGVQLRQETCIQCGLCLHQCPTSVFSGNDGAYRLLYCVSQLLDRDSIELACKFHPDPARGNYKVDAVLTSNRCLSGLSPSAYVGLFGMGVQQVIVRLDACADCALAALCPSIEKTLHDVKPLIENDGRKLIVEKDAPKRRAKTRTVYAINNPPMSRRAVFQKFVGVSHTTDLLTVFKHADTVEANVPPERRQMLSALRALPSIRPEMAIPDSTFTMLDISSACTACGLCSRVCPTDALQFRETEQTFALDFAASACINCGLCMHLCKEGAITPAGSPSIHEVMSEHSITLHTAPLKRCPKCHASFSGDGSYCPTCSFRKQNLFGFKRNIRGGNSNGRVTTG